MKKLTKLHFVLSVFALLLLVPACIATRIRPGNPQALFQFVLAWVVQSVAWAGMLYQFGMPASWRALVSRWKRFALTLAIPIVVFPLYGMGIQGWLIAFVAVVLVEFHFRGGRWRAVLSASTPWLYLAISFQIMLAWNAIIVSVRHFNLYDAFFQRIDWMLFHISVQNLAHSHAASSLYIPAEAIYFSMPGVMGAAILFLCLARDRTAAWDFAGSIAVAYYLSLILFLIFPAKGPYSLDPVHMPAYLPTAAIQHALTFNARTLYHHAAWLSSGYGYFISFPSMHIAQPLLAAWYLRRWKRVASIAFIYCALLALSILILEWHYAVDILGGILVAIAAAAIAPVSIGRITRLARTPEPATEPAQI